MNWSGYFTKVHDEVIDNMLGKLTGAELKTYFVVLRSIQKDRNPGAVSATQIGKKTKVSRQKTQLALGRLVELGLLHAVGKRGITKRYTDPFPFRSRTSDQASNLPPVGGNQHTHDLPPVGGHLQTKGGNQVPSVGGSHLPPVGGTHIESLEQHREDSSSSSVSRTVTGSEVKDQHEDEDDDEHVNHSSEELQKLAKFMSDSLVTPGQLPREAIVIDYAKGAPTWNVDEIMEALRINAEESPGRPKAYNWFRTVIADVYRKRNGIPPAVPTSDLGCQHETGEAEVVDSGEAAAAAREAAADIRSQQREQQKEHNRQIKERNRQTEDFQKLCAQHPHIREVANDLSADALGGQFYVADVAERALILAGLRNGSYPFRKGAA